MATPIRPPAQGPQTKTRDRYDWISLGVAVAGLIALIIYTGLTYWQGTLTRQALIFGNRAFIFQSNVSFGPRNINNNVFTGIPAAVIWQNNGNSAAIQVNSRMNFKAFDGPIDSTFSFPDLVQIPDIPATVGPKSPLVTGAILVPVGTLKAIQAGTQTAYIWGWARYRDQLDVNSRHLTEMCFQIVAVQGDLDSAKPTDPLNIATQPCPFHNCMDDDCRTQPKAQDTDQT